jgi:chromosome partitioning protein
MAALAAIDPADHSQLGDRARKNRQTAERHHARHSRHAAGLHGKALDTVVKQVNRVIVPVQPSLFDILATGHFLETLLAEKAVRNEQAFVAVVGMRVDPRTRSAAELERFLAQYDLPVLTHLRNTQLYVQTTMHGMTMFDLSASRAAKDLEQWQPIIDWVNS